MMNNHEANQILEQFEQLVEKYGAESKQVKQELSKYSKVSLIHVLMESVRDVRRRQMENFQYHGDQKMTKKRPNPAPPPQNNKDARDKLNASKNLPS